MPHWVPFPRSTRSRSTSEVERPIPVNSWDGRFRIPVKSVPEWIVVCASPSEASHLPGGEDRRHVKVDTEGRVHELMLTQRVACVPIQRGG